MALTYIPFSFPGLPNVRCVFQTRLPLQEGAEGNISLDVGGDPEATLRNRQILQQQLGFASWQELKQVHGDAMVYEQDAGDITAPGVIEADGHAASAPGRALVIKTADCQPVMLAHCAGKFVAALHVGWRGNRIDFIQSAVRDICARYGSAPEDVMAVRGPSLGPGRSEFINFAQEWGDDYLDFYNAERRTVDLWRMTRAQLHSAGIPEEHVYSIDICTQTHNELFFSYRADRHCGRQCSLIWMESAST